MRTAYLTAVFSMLAAPAFAADLGTYRVGTPYQTTGAPEAGVCEMQCSGDAQCRAWNYVKPGPAAPGICEFLDAPGNSVSSAISISGASEGSFAVRPDVMTGGTNTVRVGTTAAPKPRVQAHQQPSGRRIVREAVPQQRAPQAASHTRPTPQQGAGRTMGLSLEQQRAMIRGQQMRAPQAALPRASAPRQIDPRQMDPRQTDSRRMDPRMSAPGMPDPRMAPRQTRQPGFQPLLDGRAPQAPQQRPSQQTMQRLMPPQMQRPGAGAPQQPTMQRGPARRRGQQARPDTRAPQSQGRPPIGQPIAPPAASRARMTPQLTSQAPQVPQAPMPRASASNPVSFAEAQNSLYGNLNDDVRVPASNQPVPADPNAPLSLSQSRPVAPVQVEELAGARMR